MHPKNCSWARVICLAVILLVGSVSPTSSQTLATKTAQNPGSTCPEHPRQRTTQEVLNDHFAAFQSGDAAMVACDYARDAVFIQPGAVAHGRDEIQAAFIFFFGIAGGNTVASTKTLTLVGSTALLEYSVDSPHVVVTD